MVYDDLVATVRAQGSLYGLRYGTACSYISDHGTVFGFVAVCCGLAGSFGSVLEERSLLIALFK